MKEWNWNVRNFINIYHSICRFETHSRAGVLVSHTIIQSRRNGSQTLIKALTRSAQAASVTIWSSSHRRRRPQSDSQPPQKVKQNSDNWCIYPTNYPPSAPLSNWSLYFTIFAVFPFSFGYLSPLFSSGQWARLIIWEQPRSVQV